MSGVQIGASPYWVQRRLRLAGMRPISNIVDATNYAMLELGEPLHAFDYDVLVDRAGGSAPTIITRTARPGERLVTLDGVERSLDTFTELVTDTAGVLSIAGVMGGAEFEVQPRRTMFFWKALPGISSISAARQPLNTLPPKQVTAFRAEFIQQWLSVVSAAALN